MFGIVLTQEINFVLSKLNALVRSQLINFCFEPLKEKDEQLKNTEQSGFSIFPIFKMPKLSPLMFVILPLISVVLVTLCHTGSRIFILSREHRLFFVLGTDLWKSGCLGQQGDISNNCLPTTTHFKKFQLVLTLTRLISILSIPINM